MIKFERSNKACSVTHQQPDYILENHPYLAQAKDALKNIFFLKIKRYRFFLLAAFSLILLIVGIIPLKLAIARYQSPSPQAILVLGGTPKREKFTAKFAQNYPSLKIWVSSRQSQKKIYATFQAADITDTRVKVDARAVDTVTNFTSLVADFRKENIQHVYLVTSENHMPRAKAIAFFVLGSQGITFTSVAVPSSRPPESRLRILRDIGRSFLWIITGHTGASFNHKFTSSP